MPEWENIFPDIMLNSLILRAEWVARSLPPAKLRPFLRAQTFDICDIANRAAVLVRFFFLSGEVLSQFVWYA